MLRVLSQLFSNKNKKDLKRLKKIVEVINSLEPTLSTLSDNLLQAKTKEFQQRYQEKGETLHSLLPEAFATVREASKRVLKMRHYDVQLMGGVVLFEGKIAEMKTGEGKTLTATLPLYLYGLTQKGAHLVTVNDYLASRDAEEMGVLFKWLGLSVGKIVHDMEDEERQTSYRSDITYATNNELAFDYLRDNMKFDLKEYVQRSPHFCIVDEVDSILIDEARTPLLISGPSEGDTSLYGVANKVIPLLEKDKHFKVDEKAHTAILNDEGILKLQELLKIHNLFDITHSALLHHLNQALKAYNLFHLDVHYVKKDDKIIIVDEFTGRLKEGSRWSDGLHQAIEAKEGVEIKSENQTLASITFQNFFKLYPVLAGMTGTAETEATEFQKIYNLEVVVIPTNLPMVRADESDVIYKNKKAKYKAVANKIEELYKKGQPVLVGTISIESSEIISQYLKKQGIPHNVLNAKQHEREAEIIKSAGESKQVTIATNMAGRGTDIKLTEASKQTGGLFILGTERHESRRIDNQLRGRSGRQGDPGRSKFYLSLEDDLLRIFGSDRISKFMERFKMDEDEPIEHQIISRQIEKAQKKVEAHNFEIRKHLLEYDNVMNTQRKAIYGIRRDILGDQDNLGLIEGMIEDRAEMLATSFVPEKKSSIETWPWQEIQEGFRSVFHSDLVLTQEECVQKYQADLLHFLYDKAKEVLKEKLAPYEEEHKTYALRELLLSTFDQFWKDHLLSMDHLKEGINLRAYAQKDPLTEYKKESFDLFERMRSAIKVSVVEQIFSIKLYTPEEIEILRQQHQEELERQFKDQIRSLEESEGAKKIVRGEAKVARNASCPCGSGKKFKNCHGKIE